jgi:hypothetical protein|tara:strand:+ start:667 stop:846 length:180 start_codon:yes stop_codon:yes gene_type:complete
MGGSYALPALKEDQQLFFGSAFAGNALTDNAISAESPYLGLPDAWKQVAANIDLLRPDA